MSDSDIAIGNGNGGDIWHSPGTRIRVQSRTNDCAIRSIHHGPCLLQLEVFRGYYVVQEASGRDLNPRRVAENQRFVGDNLAIYYLILLTLELRKY